MKNLLGGRRILIASTDVHALEKHAFKAIIGEAMEAGRQKAAEFSQNRQSQ